MRVEVPDPLHCKPDGREQFSSQTAVGRFERSAVNLQPLRGSPIEALGKLPDRSIAAFSDLADDVPYKCRVLSRDGQVAFPRPAAGGFKSVQLLHSIKLA